VVIVDSGRTVFEGCGFCSFWGFILRQRRRVLRVALLRGQAALLGPKGLNVVTQEIVDIEARAADAFLGR
jgi:hypothetical protein